MPSKKTGGEIANEARTIFSDLIDPDVNAAIKLSLAKSRIEWKKNSPSKMLLVPFRE